MGKRVGVQDLIKAGIIKPRFPIHLNFGGQKFCRNRWGILRAP